VGTRICEDFQSDGLSVTATLLQGRMTALVQHACSRCGVPMFVLKCQFLKLASCMFQSLVHGWNLGICPVLGRIFLERGSEPGGHCGGCGDSSPLLWGQFLLSALAWGFLMVTQLMVILIAVVIQVVMQSGK